MEGFTSYIIDNDLLLFSIKTRTLYSLNTLGAYVWFCLNDGLSSEEITIEIAGKFKISRQVVERDIQEIIKDLKLLKEASGVSVIEPKNSLNDEQEFFDSSKIKKNSYQSVCKLLDTCFLIRYGDKRFLDQVQPVIAHLEIGKQASHDLAIDIIKEGENYLIIQNDRVINWCHNLSELAPIVVYEITRLAYQNTDYLLAFHSAVVGDEHACIVLPGLSGVGKSTLTAALVHSGFDYFTDEVALLKRFTNKVLPVPTSIGIKKNSWEVISSLYPIINELPVHSGGENKQIRYLNPHPDSIPSCIQEGKPVQCIIFPEYIPNRSTGIQPLSKVETLKRLADVGYQTKNELNPEKVNELVNWVSNINCFHLQHSSLPDAVKTIQRVFNESQN